MIKKFLRHHISRFLDGWQHELELKKVYAQPIDLMVRQYLSENKALGSHDRQIFTDHVYQLVKHKVFLDTIAPKPLSWEGRLDTILSNKFEANKTNADIQPYVRASCPKELFNLIAESHGEEKAIDICTSQNLRAPLTVRVNPIKITRDELLRKLVSVNKLAAKATEYSPYGITFAQYENLYELPEFKKGYFEVQDEASQLAALKVECKIGQTVLDYCAGSGGKSLAFAPNLKGTGQIYVHDIRDFMLGEARKRFTKAGISNVQFHTSVSIQQNRRQFQNKFDWVVCDVPCSGTGTLRRNPDLKYKLTKDRVDYYVDIQAKIFSEVVPFLKKDSGKIVYSTCSVLQEENMLQIAKFCKEYNLEIVGGQHFQTVPSQSVTLDGFFCAVLQHKKP